MLENQIQFGSWFNLTWHVRGGTTHPRQSGTIFGRVDDHDRGDNAQNLTRAIAAPTPTDLRTSYPGRGASRKIMAAVIQIFQPALSAKPKENRHKSSIACSPSLLPARRLEAPSAHPRGDCFLASSARKIGEAGGGAHATTQTAARLLSSVFVSRACVTCGAFPISHIQLAKLSFDEYPCWSISQLKCIFSFFCM